MTENSVDKVYIRAADVCFSLFLPLSVSLALFLSPRCFSFSLLCVRSFFRVLAEMSRDRALLTLLSRTSPLRGRFTEEYLAHEELVPATGETSNEHAPELCDAFNFIYITMKYSSFRRCMQDIIFTICNSNAPNIRGMKLLLLTQLSFYRSIGTIYKLLKNNF